MTLRTPRALAAGLLLLAPGAVRADTQPAAAPTAYQIQAIAKQGDTVGGVRIRNTADFEISALNDQGQLAFITENTAGGEALLQYAGGQFTAIAAAGQDGPIGPWPGTMSVLGPVSMNQSGQVVFGVQHGPTASPVWDGLFLWDPGSGKVTPLLQKGMSLGPGLTLVVEGGRVINNGGDIAFTAVVQDATGKKQQGVFLRGRDGQIQPVALPGQDLPGGKLGLASIGSINDAGVVAFEAVPQGDTHTSVYLWEKGTITPLLTAGSPEPGGMLFVNIINPQVNDSNPSVFLAARVGGRLGATDYRSEFSGIYRVADGQAYAVAVDGQEMPDGGKIRGWPGRAGAPAPGPRLPWLSSANEAGQIAFVAILDDGTAGAYRAEADGTVTPILRDGDSTDLGSVMHSVFTGGGTSQGIVLNGKGQVALTVRIDGGPQTIVLLTPAR